ncbi:MAG TPA: glycosyltransferase family 4 protein [Microvirga sp.]|jgi:glycosyltransferase involved in cell wall biosynthesis
MLARVKRSNTRPESSGGGTDASADQAPLRVDMLVPNGLDGPGGVARVAAVIADEFARSGGVHVRPIRSRLSADRKIAEVLMPLYLLRFAWQLASGRPDIVHINLSIGGSTLRKALFAAIARAFRVPYVIHLHGSNYDVFFARLPRFAQDRVRRLFRGAAAVVVLGEYWRRHVVDAIGVDDARVSVVDNAAPSTPPPPGDRNEVTRILFLGEVGRRKGVPELLRALADDRVRALPWQASIAGEGLIEPYRVEAERLGLGDRVRFEGWVGPDGVTALLAQSDVFVLPSHGENQPMSIIEAMGAGLAVVTTRVGAIPEMVEHERSGLLVEAGDSDALARALERVLVSPEERQRLGKAGRAVYASRFTPAVQAKKLLDVYRRVAGERRQPLKLAPQGLGKGG